eukprot:361114-Chlamydomonas_euryale.AAC.2
MMLFGAMATGFDQYSKKCSIKSKYSKYTSPPHQASVQPNENNCNTCHLLICNTHLCGPYGRVI